MTELFGESTAAPVSSDATPEQENPVAGAAETEAAETQRPGIPLWRVGKPDSFLAAEVDPARSAVLSIATVDEIGKHVGARSEGVRCVTHLFECNKPGYRGWTWFATLSRVSRGKEATVNEVGLLPTEDSVLAPAWVPWSERVRPEDQAAADAAMNLHAQHTAAHEEEHSEEESDGGAAATELVTDEAASEDAAVAALEEDSAE